MKRVVVAFALMLLLLAAAGALPPNATSPLLATNAAITPAISNTASGTVAGNVYAFGAPAVGRVVAAAITATGGSSAAITSVTIGGISATRAAKVNFTAGDTAEIWYAGLSSGSSGVISITVSAGLSGFAISVYRMVGVLAAPSAILNVGSSSGNIVVSANGLVLGVATNINSGASSFTWSGLTENTDFSLGSVEHSAASIGPISSQTRTVTATPTASLGMGLAAATWNP